MLVGSGSVILAVSVTVAFEIIACATICNIADAPLAKGPTAHNPDVVLNLPLESFEMYLNHLGNVLYTLTFAASLGP